MISKKAIETIGAKLLLPGSMNQNPVRIAKKRENQRIFKNLFFTNFETAKDIKKDKNI